MQAWQAKMQADATNGWQANLPALEVEDIPTGHSELFDEGKVETVIQTLNHKLNPVGESQPLKLIW